MSAKDYDMNPKPIDFMIPLESIPTVTAQEKGVRVVKGKAIHFTKPEVEAAAALYTAHLAQYRPEKTWGCPFRLMLTFYHGAEGMRPDDPPVQWRTAKPDLDNAGKLFVDCMTRLGFFRDDAYCAEYRAIKVDVNLNFDVEAFERRIGGCNASMRERLLAWSETTTGIRVMLSPMASLPWDDWLAAAGEQRKSKNRRKAGADK